MKRLLWTLILLPSVGWTDYHGEVEGFSLKEENIVEACIASFNKVGDTEESAYWIENYATDPVAIAVYETVLDHLLKEGVINRFDIDEAVADCKRARADEQGQ